MEALRQGVARSVSIYPEGSAQILREAIGEVHGLDPARIVRRGDGSDALLTMLANAYLQARRRSAVQRARLPGL